MKRNLLATTAILLALSSPVGMAQLSPPPATVVSIPGVTYVAGHTLAVQSTTDGIVMVNDSGEPGGGGTVTSITCGTGLSGGTIAITGTCSLASPGTATLGGVLSAAAPTHQWATGINVSGELTFAQPGSADISGLGALAAAAYPSAGIVYSTGTIFESETIAARLSQSGGTLDLASGIAMPGTYGSSSVVPVLTVDTYGRITSASTAAIPTYTLPVATSSTLGGVLANSGTAGQYVSGINTSTGALVFGTPAGTYTLPAATSSVLGGVKPDGTTIANTSGAISVGTIAGSAIGSGTVSASYLPTATTSALGVVKADGTTVTVSSGTLSASLSGLGGVAASGGTLTGGTITGATSATGTITLTGTLTATGGTVNVATAVAGTNTTQAASTAFVTAADNTAIPSAATTAPECGSGAAGAVAACSATMVLPSGTTATTQAAGDRSTKVATTAFVAGNAQSTITSFTSSGTYTVPTWAHTLQVTVRGGGGPGGNGGVCNTGTPCSGGGGGGGASKRVTVFPVSALSAYSGSIPVTVASAATHGNQGGTSVFGTLDLSGDFLAAAGGGAGSDGGTAVSGGVAGHRSLVQAEMHQAPPEVATVQAGVVRVEAARVLAVLRQ